MTISISGVVAEANKPDANAIRINIWNTRHLSRLATSMNNEQNIDELLKQWPFDPFAINVRLLELRQRKVLQMRVDMGVLQLETEGRPDGMTPHGESTYFDFLRAQSTEANEFALDEQNCIEIDREFVQFYHRRVCWLQLKKFTNAVADADHTLSLMDFCKLHSEDEEWIRNHEQYRPFVIYHRTQAAALSWLEGEGEVDTDRAIQEVNDGLERLRGLFEEYEAEDQFEEDELVVRLMEFREGVRESYGIGLTTQEQLEKAIEDEDYEKAAELRDKLESNE